MKKWIFAFASAVLMISCQGSSTKSTSSPSPQPSSSPSPEPTSSPTPQPTNSPSPEPTSSPTPQSTKVTLNWNIDSSSIVSSGSIYPASLEVPATYNLRIQPNSGAEISQNGVTQSTWTTDLSSGSYGVTVDGLDNSGRIIATGNSSLSVTDTASQSTIPLNYIMSGSGTGAFSLTVDLSHITATVTSMELKLTDPAGVIHQPTLVKNGSTYTFDDYQSKVGTYDAVLKIQTAHQTAQKTEHILILQNQATHATLQISDDDFSPIYIPVSSLSLNKNSANVFAGQVETLVPTFNDGASNTALSWKTSDDKIATVNNDGLVSFLSTGNVTITATSLDNPLISAICDYNVGNYSVKVEAESAYQYVGLNSEACSDAGAGSDLYYSSEENYADYALNLPQAGAYTLTFRVANALSYFNVYSSSLASVPYSADIPTAFKNGNFHFLSTVNISPAGATNGWKDVSVVVNLPAGTSTLRIQGEEFFSKINYFNVTAGGTLPVYTKKILFVGNSFTFYNGTVAWAFRRLAESSGKSIRVDAQTHASYTLTQQTARPQTTEAIQNGAYDIVILQGQSTESISNYSNFLSGATTLVNLAKAAGAQPYLFMTWGLTSPATTTDFVTQADGIITAYQNAASALNVPMIPVGEAWKIIRTATATPFTTQVDATAYSDMTAHNLYNGDGKHPLVNGTYLNACVFYATFFQASPVGLSWKYDENSVPVSAADALYYQSVAANFTQYTPGTPAQTPSKLQLVVVDSINTCNSANVSYDLGNGVSHSSWFDGNTTAAAGTYTMTQAGTLRLDAGFPAYISSVKVYWDALSAFQYEVQASLEGITYTTVGSINVADSAGRTDTITFSNPGNYRYVKFNIAAFTSGAKIREIEVYGVPTTALTRISPTSGTASSVNGANTADRAYNLASGSYWESLAADPQWISFDLGSAQTLAIVALSWDSAAYSAASYDWQYSDDNTIWSNYNGTASGPCFTGMAGGRTDVINLKVLANNNPHRYWRLSILGRVNSANTCRLHEAWFYK